jgi:hypothetical protein
MTTEEIITERFNKVHLEALESSSDPSGVCGAFRFLERPRYFRTSISHWTQEDLEPSLHKSYSHTGLSFTASSAREKDTNRDSYSLRKTTSHILVLKADQGDGGKPPRPNQFGRKKDPEVDTDGSRLRLTEWSEEAQKEAIRKAEKGKEKKKQLLSGKRIPDAAECARIFFENEELKIDMKRIRQKMRAVTKDIQTATDLLLESNKREDALIADLRDARMKLATERRRCADARAEVEKAWNMYDRIKKRRSERREARTRQAQAEGECSPKAEGTIINIENVPQRTQNLESCGAEAVGESLRTTLRSMEEPRKSMPLVDVHSTALIIQEAKLLNSCLEVINQ